MTFKNIAQAVAISAIAAFGTTVGAQAATCNISMPASGDNANVAAVNANIVNVLQSKYPGVAFDAPSARESSSVIVPGCNAADFAPTGANMSSVAGDLPAGAGMANSGAVIGGAAALLALVVVLNDGSSSTTTTPDT